MTLTNDLPPNINQCLLAVQQVSGKNLEYYIILYSIILFWKFIDAFKCINVVELENYIKDAIMCHIAAVSMHLSEPS